MSGLKDGLNGKVAVVTGASTPKGIGNAIARRYAAEGAALYLVAEGTEQQLSEAVKTCRGLSPNGAKIESGQLDLAEPGAPEAMIEIALETHGQIDILVNNAGIRDHKPFGEFSRTEFDKIVAVNVAAAFFASQAVLPAMRNQGGGRIIHIASQMGSVAFDKRAIYGLTKAALIHLTKTMAFELGEENIIVNSISPGPILTPAWRWAGAGQATSRFPTRRRRNRRKSSRSASRCTRREGMCASPTRKIFPCGRVAVG